MCKIYTIFGLVIFSMISFQAYAQFQDYGYGGLPIEYISGCKIDLNNDREDDIVIYIKGGKIASLIALLKTKEGYKPYLINEGSPYAYLSCKWGMGKIKGATGAGKERKIKTYKINGHYLELSFPKGEKYLYFWEGRGFTEVLVTD